ncbi:MAG: DinB family protein [Bacteroidia bacterium]
MNLSTKIEHNIKALFHSYASVTEEALNYKSAEKVWSILECLEHIYLIDKAVLVVLTTAESKYKTENNQTELFGEEKIKKLLVQGRSFKVPAPEYVQPKGEFTSSTIATQLINTVIENIKQHLATNTIEHETYTFKHPILGPMTKTDWVHFMIAHTERHLLQIEELKQKLNT